MGKHDYIVYSDDISELFGNRSTRKNTRKNKQHEGRTPTPKPSEVAKVENRINEFKPTQSQWEFIDEIDSNIVTFVDAPAGTGKTMTALWYFCKQYLRNQNMKIVVTRTPAEVGKDRVGFLPNDLQSKLEPHYASTRKILEQFLGREKVVADFEKRIHFSIPNYVLGSTMDNTLWLLDEAQLFQPIIMKLLLERIGENTKVVVSGSSTQIYTCDRDRNGMQDAMKRFFDEHGKAKYDNFALHSFCVEDVMRSEVVKSVLYAYGDI